MILAENSFNHSFISYFLSSCCMSSAFLKVGETEMIMISYLSSENSRLEIHVHTCVIHHKVLSFITESCTGFLRSSMWSIKPSGKVDAEDELTLEDIQEFTGWAQSKTIYPFSLDLDTCENTEGLGWKRCHQKWGKWEKKDTFFPIKHL